LLPGEIVGGAVDPGLALGTTQVSAVDRCGNRPTLNLPVVQFSGAGQNRLITILEVAQQTGAAKAQPRLFHRPHVVRTLAQAIGRRQLVLAFLLLFALGASVWRLGQKNLWLDEAWSWNQATMSVGTLVRSTAADDIHPPLYYVLLKAWAAVFGDSPGGLRSLSVVASLLAMVLAWRLGSRYLARGPLVAALLWLAISPHRLFYAQEARMYALTTAAVLGVCVAYRRWVESEFNRSGALVAFAISGSVAIYLHYFAGLVLVAAWAHFLTLAAGRSRERGSASPMRRPILAWLVANGAIGAAYLPWLPTAVAQISRGQAWRDPVAPSAIPGYAAQLVHDWFLGYYGTGAGGGSLATVASAAVLLVAAVGLGGLVALVFEKGRHEPESFLVWVCFLPPIVGLAALPATGYMLLSRYVSFVLPLLIIGIARGLSALRLDRRLVVAALGVGALASLPATAAYFADPVHDSDVRPIVAYLGAHVTCDDRERRAAVLVAPGYMTFCTKYASRHRGLAYRRVEERPGLWSAVDAAARALPPEGIWVIVERRWPDFDRLKLDSRLREVEVPGGHPETLRLFRVQDR
jgi:mannosyltransferase